MPHLMLECAVRAALIALGAALALSILRVKSAGARHAAWTGVVAAMLLMPVWMAWGPRASLRVLPALPAPKAAAPIMLDSPLLPSEPAPTTFTAPPPAAQWNWLAIAYFSGVGILLARLALGTIRAHALARRAQRIDGRLTSPLCATPVTVGLWKPIMILPADWRDWTPQQLDAVLAHEGEHVRRRDPLVQWLAVVNRAVFWFHPLAWWLERRISSLAEEACDAAVLQRGHDPHAYSGYLLEMARSIRLSGARLKVAGMAMPGSSLPRRIRQILTRGPAPALPRVRAICLGLTITAMSALFAAASVERQTLIPDPPLPDAPPSAPISKAESSPPSEPAQEPQPPQETQEKRLIAFYFDLDGVVPEIKARAIAAATAFVERQMRPNDRAGIMTWTNGALKVIQDFTADRDRLTSGLQKIETDPTAEPGKSDGLLAAVKLLGVLREKKSLVYFSMPALRVLLSKEEIQILAEAAVKAQVAFFPVEFTGFPREPQPAGAAIQPGDKLAISLVFSWGSTGRGVRMIRNANGARSALSGLIAPFDDTFTVKPDGTIAVPTLGDVPAAGFTTEQLENTLGPALAVSLTAAKILIRGVDIEKR